MVETSALDIGTCDAGVLRIGFQCDQAPVGRQSSRKPDGAVASESADLEDAASALRSSQELKQFSLDRRNINGG